MIPFLLAEMVLNLVDWKSCLLYDLASFFLKHYDVHAFQPKTKQMNNFYWFHQDNKMYVSMFTSGCVVSLILNNLMFLIDSSLII